METNNDSSSGTNTILIVVVLVLLVGFGVWWFTARNATPAEDNGGVNLNVTLPTGADNAPAGGVAE